MSTRTTLSLPVGEPATLVRRRTAAAARADQGTLSRLSLTHWQAPTGRSLPLSPSRLFTSGSAARLCANRRLSEVLATEAALTNRCQGCLRLTMSPFLAGSTQASLASSLLPASGSARSTALGEVTRSDTGRVALAFPRDPPRFASGIAHLHYLQATALF